jgi:hypothetical protein
VSRADRPNSHLRSFHRGEGGGGAPLMGVSEPTIKLVCGLIMPTTPTAGSPNSPTCSRSSSPPLPPHLRPRQCQTYLRARAQPAPMLRRGGSARLLGISLATERFCSATSLSGVRPVTCGFPLFAQVFLFFASCLNISFFGVEWVFAHAQWPLLSPINCRNTQIQPQTLHCRP